MCLGGPDGINQTIVPRYKAGWFAMSAAIRDSAFCYFHDPGKAAERQDSCAAGGRQNRMKTLDAATSDMNIKDCGNVFELLSETINQVRRGEIDPRVANSVGYLASITVKVLEQNALEDRITRLEELLERRTNSPESMLTGS
jgi:hypothetical protein